MVPKDGADLGGHRGAGYRHEEEGPVSLVNSPLSASDIEEKQQQQQTLKKERKKKQTAHLDRAEN